MRSNLFPAARGAAIVFCVVFASSLFGILNRPTGFLSSLWLANALLLALFVRFPQLAGPLGWLSAIAGFFAADMVTGNTPAATLLLTIANLTGIATGYLLFAQVAPATRKLLGGGAVVTFFGICLASAIPPAIFGGWVSTALYGRSFLDAAVLWFSSEFTSYLTLMPFILAIPDDWVSHFRNARHKLRLRRPDQKKAMRRLLPVAAIVAGCVSSALIGGPGAIIFPIALLSWAALSYSLFTTTVILLAYALWCQIAISLGLITLSADMESVRNIVSIRFGIALLALGPLAVASVNVSRNALLQALDKAANNDFLTKALTRRAFMRKGAQFTENPDGAYAVLMLDIDHFKSVNDRFGHDIGDAALVSFAETVFDNLGEEELFGRMGGEEFAALIPDIDEEAALEFAEKLRAQIAAKQIALPDNSGLPLTTSIGMVLCRAGQPQDIGSLLKIADQALYRAKAAGRNRVETVVL